MWTGTDVKLSVEIRILSVGDDAILRIVSTTAVRDGDEEDEDAIKVEQHKGAITCIHVDSERIVTGSEDHSVCLYSLPTGQYQRLLLRCTLTVRDVVLRPGRHGTNSAQWAAIASDELDIKVVDTEDITNIMTLRGHRRGLKSLSFDSRGEFLISAGSDGELMVWDLRGEKPKCERVLRSIIATSDPETNEYCRMSWHPSGKNFAIPGKLGDTVIIEAYTWRHLYSLKETNQSDCIALVAWSNSGALLATVTVQGRLCIWKPDDDRKKPLFRDQAKCRITGLAWHPKEDDLCMTDELGRMSYWANAIPASAQEKGELERLFDEEATEVNEGDEQRSDTPRKKDEELAQYNASMLDDLGEDENPDDFVVDDDGAGYANPLDKPGQLKRYYEKGRAKVVADLEREYGGRRQMDLSGLEVQEAFQPGATPLQADRKYLAFNMVGVIYTIDLHTHHNMNVEFHDRSIRPFHFTDYHNYSMACLGESGACFASEASSGNPSTLFYRPFDTWATKADWTMHFRETESVKAIAITSSGPVAATSQRYLRFFSYSGLQTFVMSLPGPVVTMTGKGDWLLIIYHAGGVYHGEQNLAYMLFHVPTKRSVRRDGLPISPGSTLQWVGISDLGIPTAYDSTGVLRNLMRHNDFAWVPVLDSRIVRGEKQEWYWPVEVMEDRLMCITCKGADRLPPFPRPLMSDIPLQAPFLDMDTPNGVEEENHNRGEAEEKGEVDLREKDLLKQDVEMDKIIVKLILTACKAEKVQRALDLCGTLHTIKAIDGAIKIAVMHHLPALAERMNIVKEGRLRQERQSEERRLRQSSQTVATPHSGISAVLSAMDSDVRRDGSHARVRSDEMPTPGPVRIRNSRGRTSSGGIAKETSAFSDKVDATDELESSETSEATSTVKERRSSTHAVSAIGSTSENDTGGTLSRVHNPFAVGGISKPPAMSGSKNLFDAIKGVTSAKKIDADTKGRENEDNVRKRKNQTTLFGISRKDEDGVPPNEKRARRSEKKPGSIDDTDLRPSDNQVKGAVHSIASFFGRTVNEDGPADDRPLDDMNVEDGTEEMESGTEQTMASDPNVTDDKENEEITIADDDDGAKGHLGKFKFDRKGKGIAKG
ncbi:hypothetical protein SpCBS45565_g07825 [Spizellomyces sp. 'palustris']|nr:hypothetical protein SpCBS45565_g07825 [Spizellomyces sp. 'palustris']